MNKNHGIHKQIMKLTRHFNTKAKLLYVNEDNSVTWVDYNKHRKDDAILAYINNIPAKEAYKIYLANTKVKAIEDNIFMYKNKEGKEMYALIDIEGQVICVQMVGDMTYDEKFETYEGHVSYKYAKENYDEYQKKKGSNGFDEFAPISAFVPMMLHGEVEMKTKEEVLESLRKIKKLYEIHFKY